MRRSIAAFFQSFRYAAAGIVRTVRSERNFRFHLTAAAAVTAASVFYDFSAAEYCALFLCIGSVLAAELVNTAIESAVDEITPCKRTENAERAKDAAAGAVLVSATASAVCGAVLFWDREAFARIAAFYSGNITAAVCTAAWAAASFWFVFGAYGGRK